MMLRAVLGNTRVTIYCASTLLRSAMSKIIPVIAKRSSFTYLLWDFIAERIAAMFAFVSCPVTVIKTGSALVPAPVPMTILYPTFVIVTVAVPLLAVFTVDVALTLTLVAVSPVATVNRPLALMLVPVPPPETDQVTVWAGLLAPLISALNWKVWPFATEAVEGLTVTKSTVGVAGPVWVVIVTVAVPLIAVFTVDVALTVTLVAVSAAATVKRPSVLMPVPAMPPETVQVTV